MTPGFYHLITHAPVLRQFGGDLDRMVAQYPSASSGERILIRAALACLHPGDKPEGAEHLHFSLHDISGLDASNATVLIEAIAVQTGHGIEPR